MRDAAGALRVSELSDEERLDEAFAAYEASHGGEAPDGSAEKPLTRKQYGYGLFWDGNHITACERAGYAGSKATLSRVGTRLSKDPRIQRLIEERRERGELGEAAGPEAAPTRRGPELPVTSIKDAYRAIAADTALPMSERRRALERLEQMERREQPALGVEEWQQRVTAMTQARVKALLARGGSPAAAVRAWRRWAEKRLGVEGLADEELRRLIDGREEG